jgi:hypothetical protein
MNKTMMRVGLIGLCLGFSACVDGSGDEDVVLSDEELTSLESLTDDTVIDEDVELVAQREGRVNVMRLRAALERDGDRCPDHPRWRLVRFDRFPRICWVERRVDRPDATCATALCPEGTVCEDWRGNPVCFARPERRCAAERDCDDPRICIGDTEARWCASLPGRTDL